MLYEPSFAPRWYVRRADVAGDALTAVAAIAELVSFEPDRVEVTLDGERLELEPGQNVVSHGIDRDLSVGEAGALRAVAAGPA